MAYKALDGIPLRFTQIRICILKLSEISHIGEQLFRRDKIFVRIIEIREYHVTPEDKFIKRFRLGIQFPVAVIQIQQQSHPVCNLRAVGTQEKIIDRKHFRSHHRSDRSIRRGRRRFLGKTFRKIFPEKCN